MASGFVDVWGLLARDNASYMPTGDAVFDGDDAAGSGVTVGRAAKDEDASLLAGIPPAGSGRDNNVETCPPPEEATSREDLWNAWSGGGSARSSDPVVSKPTSAVVVAGDASSNVTVVTIDTETVVEVVDVEVVTESCVPAASEELVMRLRRCLGADSVVFENSGNAAKDLPRLSFSMVSLLLVSHTVPSVAGYSWRFRAIGARLVGVSSYCAEWTIDVPGGVLHLDHMMSVAGATSGSACRFAARSGGPAGVISVDGPTPSMRTHEQDI